MGRTCHSRPAMTQASFIAPPSCLAHIVLPGALYRLNLESGLIGSLHDNMWVVLGHLAMAENCRFVAAGDSNPGPQGR